MHEHLPVHRLTGGLRLPAAKDISTRGPIRRGLVPTSVTLSLREGRGPDATPLVQPGDQVLRGQIIATASDPYGTNVHASTSGRVVAIGDCPVPAYDGVTAGTCITIRADGRHAQLAAEPRPPWPASAGERLAAIAGAGIVGLGGAAFPTAAKLAASGAGTLIVNGVECEPYISCDDMLMRECAREIVAGTALMAEIIGAGRSIIAIERDKPEAIESIRHAVEARADDSILVTEIPTVYPAGGERQLIDVIAGVEVPSGRYPGDAGFVCQNVGTAYAVAILAASGAPLTTRIVTVSGRAIAEPGNVEVPIGTPISEVIEFCGGCRLLPERLVHGGGMMGYPLPDLTLPVTKSTNCLILAAPGELKAPDQEWPCIRCGECAITCPARLLPQELLFAARGDDTDTLSDAGLDDCIECGCCDVVCPSHIPLTVTFRRAKTSLAHARQQDRLSAASIERFHRREERTREAALAEERRQTALKDKVGDAADRQAAIAAAVERARRRKAKQHTD